MCGITGIYSYKRFVKPRWIESMTDIIRHRGPDDEGYLSLKSDSKKCISLIGNDSKINGIHIKKFSEKADLFLGHRRLSILDVSILGHQPMSNKKKNIWITYNGEIYNYIEIRNELIKLGYSFSTKTDTEVLLYSYEEWGEDCLQRFNGMWSFTIYDKRKNTLFGARDRFGVKPFYYYYDTKIFAFASEIKSLVSLPFIEKKINKDSLFDFLAFSGIAYNEETIFKSIFELQPSSSFTLHLPSNTFKIKKYYSLKYNNKWEDFNVNKSVDYIADIKNLFTNSVKLRLRSDVPVGAALSGGIDSTSIVCLINNIKQTNKSPINTNHKVFTASFVEEDIDESKWAHIAANHSSAQWYRTFPKLEDYIKDIEKIAYVQDTPYGSPSIYAQYKVMELAKKEGIKVLLDGQGGDELFTGYTMYYDLFLYDLLKNLKIKNLFIEIGSLNNAPVSKSNAIDALLRQIRRNIVPYWVIKKKRTKQNGMYNYINPEFWDKKKDRFDLIKDRDFESLNQMLFEFFTRQKLQTLLKYEDRNSMSFSIESRTPFADDINLIEHAFAIPSSYKIHNGWSKYLLRESMKNIIPDDIRKRVDKKGFSTPEKNWFQILKLDLMKYITDDLEEFVNVQYLRKNINKNYNNSSNEEIQMIWNIFSFAVWKKVFI